MSVLGDLPAGPGRAALAAIAPESGLGLPRDVSMDGHRIDFLLHTTHLHVGVLLGVMCAWMALSCLRHGRRHRAVYDPGGSRRSVIVTLSLSAFVFAVVDGNLAINSFSDLRDVFWNWKKPESDPRTVRVQVNAHQWAWDFRYPGPDKRFGTPDDLLQWNTLTVPAGAPVMLQLASTDVIHSFWLPNLRVKQDVVPGQVSRLWFQPRPEAVGEYAIACTQHCGANHYKMGGVLRVLSPEHFARWQSQAEAVAERGYDPEDPGARWGWEWK